MKSVTSFTLDDILKDIPVSAADVRPAGVFTATELVEARKKRNLPFGRLTVLNWIRDKIAAGEIEPAMFKGTDLAGRGSSKIGYRVKTPPLPLLKRTKGSTAPCKTHVGSPTRPGKRSRGQG